MTCIIALEHNGRVYMGGDSAGSDGWDTRIRTTQKVFRKQDLLIGYTWSFRMGQVIQHGPNIPEMVHPDNYTYLIQKFVPFIRDAFREAGWLKTENARDEGGQFLVGIRGEIFSVESDFSVLRAVDGYDSVGCGKNYALGAMRMLKYSGKAEEDPRMAVALALETAAYFSNGVSGPFVFKDI